jgi:2-polyprenyl-6-methoxyphenol hydroxylase-like FAD-dependent oxidoreductase
MVFTASDRTAEQHIVIAGAGRVGHRTAQALDDYGHEVYLIERDSATVERVTGRRTGVVIEGDATDPDILGQTDPERAISGLSLVSTAPRGRRRPRSSSTGSSIPSGRARKRRSIAFRGTISGRSRTSRAISTCSTSGSIRGHRPPGRS